MGLGLPLAGHAAGVGRHRVCIGGRGGGRAVDDEQRGAATAAGGEAGDEGEHDDEDDADGGADNNGYEWEVVVVVGRWGWVQGAGDEGDGATGGGGGLVVRVSSRALRVRGMHFPFVTFVSEEAMSTLLEVTDTSHGSSLLVDRRRVAAEDEKGM